MMTETNVQIISEAFAPGISAYVRRIIPIWLARRWWLVLVPAALLIASLWWTACLFVALMVVFLLYPSVLMMVYMSYATSRRAMQWIYTRRVSIDNAGFEVKYYAEEGFKQTPDDARYKWSDVSHVTFSGKYVIAHLSANSYDLIPLMPTKAADADTDRLKDMLAALGIEFA